MSNPNRFDLVVLIKLHDCIQYIGSGNLETEEAEAVADVALDCHSFVSDGTNKAMIDAIKAMNPTRSEILEAFNLLDNDDANDVVAIYQS